MSFWKKLATVVVVVAAAPLTGGTSLAVGAASLAAAAKSALDEKVNKARREGERDGKKEIQPLLDALMSAKSTSKGDEKFGNLVIAMHAVGLACAACDGEISSEEREAIDAFVSGESGFGLPDHVRKQITKLNNNPPSIQTAYKLASKLDYFPKDAFERVIELTMYSDDKIHPSEVAFKSAWKKLAA
jgi:uncharacterized membrane protein YebE (DUF533 family)